MTGTSKWRKIFPLFDDVDREVETSSHNHHQRVEVTRPIKQKYGKGIVHFLPGDIKGLKTKLNYLLAEYRAGNRLSTKNEIVAILDELLRRKKISQQEYKDINTFLQ